MRNAWIKIAGAAAAVAAFFIVSNIQITGMTEAAGTLLALLISAIILWLTMPIPIYMTGLLISVVPWAMGIVSFETAFSGFSGSTFWFLFAALGIAGCIQESGVARRLALWLTSRVEPTFGRLMVIILVTMFILGYLLPLGAARVALMLAILTPLVTFFHVQQKSNIGKAITLGVAMFGMASSWQILTGGAPGLVLWGSLSSQGYEVSWFQWAAIMVVPTILVLIFVYLAITRLFKPEINAAPGGKQKILEELKNLGPMTGAEKRALGILGLIILLWLTEPIHHIKSDIIGITGVFLFVVPGIGITNFENFARKLIPWSLLLFVGAVISLAAMAAETGMNTFLNDQIVDPVYSIASNGPLFITSTWLLNTIAGSLMLFIPSIPLFTGPITQAATAAGVSPIIGALVYLSCFPQVLFYAAMPFFPLAYNYGAIRALDWVKAGVFFFIAWPIAHIICLYTWYPLLEAIGVI